jgi:2-C-methyl-D-erythritol 4-phosphate cytidylyltransferase
LSGPDAGARVDVVIVAAGGSARMGGIDKLDAPLLGRPLLAWSVGAFAALPEVARLLVVTASDRVAGVREAPWLPAGAEVVAGGARRQDSVAAGVRALDVTPDRVVLVHDGARPCVTHSVIRSVAAAAAASTSWAACRRNRRRRCSSWTTGCPTRKRSTRSSWRSRARAAARS